MHGHLGGKKVRQTSRTDQQIERFVISVSDGRLVTMDYSESSEAD